MVRPGSGLRRRCAAVRAAAGIAAAAAIPAQADDSATPARATAGPGAVPWPGTTYHAVAARW
ncbi:hypothetical protein [Yinghuangia sp. YIM S09857]|uniref:hypothetical protein n=1 Tax=Yinghuangia sp. YIM S09857 TaxID=3436929 RepID=UPI003F52BE41